MDLNKQLHAYVAWVNSQLRKKPGCRLVSDLKTDFKDGVALAHLIEVVSGVKVNGIDYNPKTINSKRSNVEKVLHFMANKKMESRFISAKDVNGGNLKAIMRLILVIARHYKPTSVSTVQKPTDTQQGYGSLDNRRNVPTSEHGLRVLATSDKYATGRHYGYSRSCFSDGFSDSSITNQTWSAFKWRNGTFGDTDGDYAGTDSDVSGHESHMREYRYKQHLNDRLINGGGEVDGASCMSSPVPSIAKQRPTAKSSITPAKSLPCLQKCFNGADKDGYRDYENVPMYSMDEPNVSAAFNSKLLGGNATENVDIKRHQGTNTFAGTSPEGKLVALQNYLHQTSEKCHDLHSNLKRAKEECATLEDLKDDLQTRVIQQDKSILQFRQELAKLQLAKQSLETEKEELIGNVHIKEEQLVELRRQLSGKDKIIHQQKNQFDDAIRNLSLANKAKACLTARLADQDRKIALLEQARSQKTPMREELQVVHDALKSLRSGFRRNDPQHHTIDTLEQSFSLLMERLHMADIQKVANGSGGHTDSKRLNFDSTGDPRRSPLTPYHGYCLQKLDNTDYGTKVVYFTEKTVTPFMSSIPKKLGEIQLRDFKTMFDRPGNYRYHFKSVDPEYGMVKEEILHDDDILPGWDGKIIAWVEEDHG